MQPVACIAFLSMAAVTQVLETQLPVGQPADLVLFGHFKSWNPSGEDTLFSRKSGAAWMPVSSNFGVEWDEPREIGELRATFGPNVAPEKIHPEYWASKGSENPPGGGQGGWTLTDTPWNGTWKPILGSAHGQGGTWTFRFEAPASEEIPNKQRTNTPPVNSRRTLKVRLRFDDTPAPEVKSFEAFGPSRWNIREVLLEMGCQGKPVSALSLDAYNGRVLNTTTEGNLTHARVAYLEHFADSNDRTVLTVRTQRASFGIGLDDLIHHKSIYVRDLGIFVGDGAAGSTFQTYLASGRLRPGNDILSQVARHPEQSLEHAMSDIPEMSMRDRSGRHPNRYIPVGMFADREKYGVEFNGNIFISKQGSKVFPEEQARMQWRGDELSYRIGTGPIPDFRERERSATQSVADGYLPILRTDWTQEGLSYHEEVFATLLTAQLDTLKIRGDETSVLLAKLTVTNTTHAPKNSMIWLHVNPQEKVVLRDGLLLGIGDQDREYAQPRLRAVLKSSAGAFETATLPIETEVQGAAAVWKRELGAHEAATLNFALTFHTLHEDAEIQRLRGLDYAQERSKVASYWSRMSEAGSRLHVPDQILDEFYRSALQHILLSVQRDVSTGLYMAPCGTYDYNMFANETDIQVRLLDLRGLPDFAAKFLEPFFQLQGSKAFPGRFQRTDAILNGVRVDPAHDYTHSGYNLNHGWTLWTAAEHYLLTRDRDWLQAHKTKMENAADWIVSERRATMRKDENDQTVWEYGLLPPGQLEDNEEWQYWFAVNAYAYRGLQTAGLAIADINPATGTRLQNEAAQYREDIRKAAFRSMEAVPAVALRDGSWVPTLGTRTQAHGRDVGWIRNILYGPQVLVDCGIFSPEEPVTGWVLNDLEDNLFMSPESFSVAEQDWFSRGGITLQPNLVNTSMIYLDRDEIPAALRAFYNAFAVSYYRDVNMFSEWESSFGRSGGPFFKTSDEAASLTWLRQMLVHEQGDTLYLAAGAPRRWFRAGQKIEFTHAPTYFGPISLLIDAHPERGQIEAAVDVPDSFRGKNIELRLRNPEAKPITRVEIDGQSWTRFDPLRERISLPTAPGRKHVIAYF